MRSAAIRFIDDYAHRRIGGVGLGSKGKDFHHTHNKIK
jgi:hypothetical protein